MTTKRCHRPGCCGAPKRIHKRDGGKCARGWRETMDVLGETFWYAYGEPGSECSCPGYVSPPVERVRRGRGAAKRGAAAEQRKVAGPGRPDVLSAEVATEVWVHAIPKNLRQKMAQAQRLRSGRTAVLRVEDPRDRYTLEMVEA